MGDVIRQLVEQFMKRFETATRPFLFALSMWAGCESIVHVVQTCTDADPRTTLSSIDGVGAFDLISRRAMLTALHDVPDGTSILPFVLQFFGHPLTHLWEDEGGVHEIPSGRRRRTRGPFDAGPFCTWAVRALIAIQESLRPTVKIMAFVYVLGQSRARWSRGGVCGT